MNQHQTETKNNYKQIVNTIIMDILIIILIIIILDLILSLFIDQETWQLDLPHSA